MSECTCAHFRGTLGPDIEAERVAELVAAGWSQRGASLLVWAPELLDERAPLTRWTVAEWVRGQLLARSPWLRP